MNKEELYHISTGGTPERCNAEVRACPRGKHFTNIEKAQKYADFINEGASEPVKSTLEKHRTAMGLYEVKNLFNQYNKQVKKIDRINAILESRYKKYLFAGIGNKMSKEDFFATEIENDSEANCLFKKYNRLLNDIQSIHADRKQSMEFATDLSDKMSDYSFSIASSSSYFVFEDRNIEDVKGYLDEKGYSYMIRPDYDIVSDGSSLVRMSNHFPKEYYKSKTQNVNDVWKYTNANVLVFYKDEPSNTMPKKVEKETDRFVSFMWKKGLTHKDK